MANILRISVKKRQKRLIEERNSKSKKVFEVRDLREREWFVVDNTFLDGKWMKLLKGCPVAVYFALCRHADQKQVSFPAIDYLMDETGYGKRHVTRAIKTLEFHRLISVDRKYGENNIYSLLNKKHWRKTISTKEWLVKK